MSKLTERIAKDVFNLERNDVETGLALMQEMIDANDVDEWLAESIIRSMDDDEAFIAAVEELEAKRDGSS
ncbi:MAG: hypothetical protein ABI333_26260 [bacterium]